MKWVAVLRVLTLCFGEALQALLQYAIHAYSMFLPPRGWYLWITEQGYPHLCWSVRGPLRLVEQSVSVLPSVDMHIYDTACFHSVSDWCGRKSVCLLSTNLPFKWWVIVFDRASQFSGLNL